MIKPQRLKKGDTVAIVSLSRGMLGEPWAIHKLTIAKQRLENDFGLKVKVMPNALKGMDYLYQHPEARAQDLMDAFSDKDVKAIFTAIGGDDTIRLLPYIDFDVIKNNPKIFAGFSDTTVNHLMMRKAGLISYYGASIMNNWAEYIKINDYTLDAFKNIFFEPKEEYEVKSSPVYSLDEDKVWWKEENINTPRKYHKEEVGYQVLQGTGRVQGELIGGCVDTFTYLLGTSLWPTVDDFKGKILLLETSEDNMSPMLLTYILRNLQAQGVLDVINGIIVGKPTTMDYFEEYKEVYKKVVAGEAKRPDLPILYNVNVGHAEPIGVFALGCKYEIDCDNKKLTLFEPATL